MESRVCWQSSFFSSPFFSPKADVQRFLMRGFTFRYNWIGRSCVCLPASFWKSFISSYSTVCWYPLEYCVISLGKISRVLLTRSFRGFSAGVVAKASRTNTESVRKTTQLLMISSSRGGHVAVYVFDINQPSLPTPFILFLCLFLSLRPFQLYFIPYILPTTLRFLTLFLRSYFCLIGPFNYISLYESLHQP